LNWRVIDFGKHAGKTLTEILMEDPAWFYWGIDNNVFRHNTGFLAEASELSIKGRFIKLPQSIYEDVYIEFIFNAKNSYKYKSLRLVPSIQPEDLSIPKIRNRHIDLSIFYNMKISIDSKRHLLKDIKKYLFGRNFKKSKNKYDQFFNNDDNFCLPDHFTKHLKTNWK